MPELRNDWKWNLRSCDRVFSCPFFDECFFTGLKREMIELADDSEKTKVLPIVPIVPIAPIVEDEKAIFERVERHLRDPRKVTRHLTNYDEELISLRDAIGEAHPEDIPPLVEQMTRLQALAAQQGRGEETPVDPTSPYFGHLRLEESGVARDVLLGKHTYLAPDDGIRIVDWRNAPVSRMYYSYDQDDDYEEVFGGKTRQGLVTARRSVTITEAQIKRITAPEGVFAFRKDKWVELDSSASQLSGGQGKAVRAEGLRAIRGVLGVDADGVDRVDKHMPEIAALLDKTQFEMISSSRPGMMIIQGGAGSGKTTVALHRIAFLAFDNPRRYRSRRMLVVVFNEGLAAYISRVLPALGVHGVRVTTFDRWARSLRRYHIKGLPMAHSDVTPSIVSRLKRHPAMLRILDDFVDEVDQEVTEKFFNAVGKTPDSKRVETAWNVLQRLPLDARRYRMLRWLESEVRIGNDRGHGIDSRTAVAAESALNRMARYTSDVVSDWADLFTDRQALGRAFALNAPADFTETELDTVHAWCVEIYRGLGSKDDDESPVIDQEDEAILLRLYQLKRGWLRGKGGRLVHDHLMVDEAQDFSPLEISVMLQTVGYGQSVTLAGDTQQKIVREGGFTSWDELLADLGIEGQRVPPLEVAYRSTVEIMRLAADVLGPYANDQPTATRHGAPVELHQFSDPGQAVGFLGEALRGLGLREPLANVAVVARHTSQARMYYEGLRKAEIARLKLVVDEGFSFAPGVEVCEVRQIKGLEFDYVVLVEVGSDSYPDNEDARHLLHVGVTRAAHQLWVCTGTKPSPLLPDWLLNGE
jgi:ATP-dependent DNA helicase UvrD/PcrA